MNTVGDPGVCGQVVSVGAYITDATWESNYGSTGAGGRRTCIRSARAVPTEAGGFKPTSSRPGAAISTTPMWQAGGPVAGTYTLPPGYSMLNGTSMASPQIGRRGGAARQRRQADRRAEAAAAAAPGADLLGARFLAATAHMSKATA